MNKYKKLAITLCLTLAAPLAGAQDMVDALAEAAGIPQVSAFLPDRYSVAQTDPMPIDGVWTISTIRKRIRFEGGRAFAVDPWTHMFVLKVQPDMVVVQDIRRTGAGVYEGFDLPLLGESTMRIGEDGNLDVLVQGKLGPARFRLLRRELDDGRAFNDERERMAGRMPEAPIEAPPARRPVERDEVARPDDADPLANCDQLAVDSTTGEVVCLD